MHGKMYPDAPIDSDSYFSSRWSVFFLVQLSLGFDASVFSAGGKVAANTRNRLGTTESTKAMFMLLYYHYESGPPLCF